VQTPPKEKVKYYSPKLNFKENRLGEKNKEILSV
jgi:hypothetical protein